MEYQGAVAQLARATRSHRVGRGFDSHQLHQNFLIAKDLTVKSLAIFLFIPLTVAGTYGFSAESRRLLFSTLNHTSNSILHHFFGKSL